MVSTRELLFQTIELRGPVYMRIGRDNAPRIYSRGQAEALLPPPVQPQEGRRPHLEVFSEEEAREIVDEAERILAILEGE